MKRKSVYVESDKTQISVYLVLSWNTIFSHFPEGAPFIAYSYPTTHAQAHSYPPARRKTLRSLESFVCTRVLFLASSFPFLRSWSHCESILCEWLPTPLVCPAGSVKMPTTGIASSFPEDAALPDQVQRRRLRDTVDPNSGVFSHFTPHGWWPCFFK